MGTEAKPLSIIVVGASGDLARKKIYPALFALHCQGYLPSDFRIFGFARSTYSDEAFREEVTRNLTCRYTPGASCQDRMEEFLSRCHYVAGSYDSSDSFLELYQRMQRLESGKEVHRFYYLAIPPSVFVDVARAIGDAGLVSCGSGEPWSRVVIEKPFGRDRQTSDELTQALSQVFVESQMYRIDHYLGKEVIQNLLALRFANLVFEPIWNRNFIRRVKILWKEDLSLAGRGGYFDQYGIIRDVCQNHLIQILSLVAMEPPVRLQAAHIAQEKVKVLQAIPPLQLDDLVIGQYRGSRRGETHFPSYVDDETVPSDSITPTYAAARLQIENRRWHGVPFLIEAGKGLDARMTEIRIEFQEVPGNMFCMEEGCPEANELVIRVQPDESIYLNLIHKVPGMEMKVASRKLDLQYKTAFSEQLPDAYESLILDVIEGDRSLFIRSDELEVAWDIFTPVLRQIDREQLVPEPYDFGSEGPAGARRILE